MRTRYRKQSWCRTGQGTPYSMVPWDSARKYISPGLPGPSCCAAPPPSRRARATHLGIFSSPRDQTGYNCAALDSASNIRNIIPIPLLYDMVAAARQSDNPSCRVDSPWFWVPDVCNNLVTSVGLLHKHQWTHPATNGGPPSTGPHDNWLRNSSEWRRPGRGHPAPPRGGDWRDFRSGVSMRLSCSCPIFPGGCASSRAPRTPPKCLRLWVH